MASPLGATATAPYLKRYGNGQMYLVGHGKEERLREGVLVTAASGEVFKFRKSGKGWSAAQGKLDEYGQAMREA